MDNWFILVLIAASLPGSGLMFLALRRGAEKQEAYAAFAQAQGWSYAHDKATNRTADVVRFSDPADDWTIQIIFSGGGATGGSSDRRVEWHTPQGALEDGEAVLGMPIPEKAVMMLQSGGPIGQQVLKAALKGTLYALGRTRFTLEVDEATAGDPGGVVMATEGRAQAMDRLRPNPALAEFRATRKSAEVPVILRNAQGLTLRRPGAVKRLEDLTALVDLGLSLRASLVAEGSAPENP